MTRNDKKIEVPENSETATTEVVSKQESAGAAPKDTSREQTESRAVVLPGQVVDQSTGEVTMGGLALPTDLLAEVEGLDDLGYSEKSEDSMIPILSILQDNSAEVKKKHSKYIEGAEAGDLIVRSLGRVFKMGDNLPPIVVQPAGFDHVWVEWQGEPGEGAPVGQFAFDDRPRDAREVPDSQNPDRTLWRMPNGNRLVDTRYHYANVICDDGSLIPLVIPMGGTNHTASRQWTAQMKQHRLPGRMTKAPSFFRQYGLRTAYKQRGEQSWYNYKIDDLGWITDENTLRNGLALLSAVRDQTVTVESAASGGGVSGASDDSIPI
jgi:hypothetical protein